MDLKAINTVPAANVTVIIKGRGGGLIAFPRVPSYRVTCGIVENYKSFFKERGKIQCSLLFFNEMQMIRRVFSAIPHLTKVQLKKHSKNSIESKVKFRSVIMLVFS